MSISKHFQRSEFACKCKCGFATVDVELLKLLEVVREHFNQPITINSACRCEAHNKAIGGSKGSKHKLGVAADIVVKGVLPVVVYKFIDGHVPDTCGLGSYATFTHIDIRQHKARWVS